MSSDVFAKSEKPVRIQIDGKNFSVDYLSMTGGQLKGLVGRGPQYNIFREIGNHLEDRAIHDVEAVPMSDGLSFYTVPKAPGEGVNS